MSRGTPAFQSGTLPAVGSGQRDLFFDALLAAIETYQSNGEQAWAKTTISSRNVALHSVGDRSLGTGSNKGDTDIWLGLWRSGNEIRWDLAQDYSPTSGAWFNAYRQGYQSNGLSLTSVLSDTAQIDWWMCLNESEIFIQFIQSGARFHGYTGNAVRMYSARINGVARITSQSGTGNGVVLGLDRDISASIQPGQSVHLINQTPDGVAIQSVAPLLCPVVSVTANSITLNGVSNTYAVGSLCGVDPTSNWINSNAQTGTNFYGIMRFDCTYVSMGNLCYLTPSPYPGVEGDNDPCADNYYPLCDAQLYGSASPHQVNRGKLGIVRLCPYGAQADGDIMRVEGDTAQDWKCWVSTEYQVMTSWATCAGPGAT